MSPLQVRLNPEATRAMAVRLTRAPVATAILRPGPEEANVAGAVSNQRSSSPNRADGGRVYALGVPAAANESRTA